MQWNLVNFTLTEDYNLIYDDGIGINPRRRMRNCGPFIWSPEGGLSLLDIGCSDSDLMASEVEVGIAHQRN